MSRAVDDEIRAELQRCVLEKVYYEISTALCPDPPRLLEIEFLGKSHPLPIGSHFLADGHCIAIPKSKVILAFVYARELFFQNLGSGPQTQPDLFQATAVILLMDPEHLTAANWRKRSIKYSQTESKQNYESLLRRELVFVDSYLTSRLHRHTKSPTLWSHRRWLLEQFNAMKFERSLERDLKSIVLVAAERHPRNYYAWLHMRWLVQDFNSSMSEIDQALILSMVKNWCLKHPADTSGFSFLLFYLDFLGRCNLSRGTQLRTDAFNSVYTEVLELAASFKWTHESVWVFLRTLAAASPIGAHKAMLLQTVDSIIRTSADPKVSSTLQASIECIRHAVISWQAAYPHSYVPTAVRRHSFRNFALDVGGCVHLGADLNCTSASGLFATCRHEIWPTPKQLQHDAWKIKLGGQWTGRSYGEVGLQYGQRIRHHAAALHQQLITINWRVATVEVVESGKWEKTAKLDLDSVLYCTALAACRINSPPSRK